MNHSDEFTGFWIKEPDGNTFYVALSSADSAKMTDDEVIEFIHRAKAQAAKEQGGRHE